jgi:hypothetical protein
MFIGKKQSADNFWRGSMLPLWSKDFPVVVSWSPKSGCTTILKWFLDQNNLLEAAYSHNPWVHEYREKILYAQKNYKTECKDAFTKNTQKKYILKVIRNPLHRSVSSYLHYLRYGVLTKGWEVVREIETWKASNGLSRQKGLSFRQFLNFVLNQDLISIRNDPHFGQQYDARQDEKVDLFIPIESISSEIRKIENKFGMTKIDLNELSNSVHNNRTSDSHNWPAQAASFPADDDFNRKLGVPPAEIFLDHETRLLIRNVYWRDFEKYSEYYKS